MKHFGTCFLVMLLISCGKEHIENENLDTKNPIIISFDNQPKFNEFRKLNLDSIYPNLLDPSSSFEKEHKAVIRSWREFHQKVSKFTWEVPDSTISIVNKIYFDRNGTVDYFSFRILNPSIPNSKKTEFEALLQEFTKTPRLICREAVNTHNVVKPSM